MTDISQLELLYSQMDNLNKEIETLLEEEEYDLVMEKVNAKDELIKHLARIR